MEDQDIAAVLRQLSKAQREAIRKATDRYGVFGTQPFRNRLAKLGICSYAERAGRGTSWLFPLGERIKAHLDG